MTVSRRRALLTGSALLAVPFVAGCAMTATQTATIQNDLQLAITIGTTVNSLLALLGVSAPICALAAIALTAAQAALKAWESNPTPASALTVLSNVATIYSYLPTADATALAKITAESDVAHASPTDGNLLTFAAEVAAVYPEVNTQLKVAKVARAAAIKVK